MLVRRLLKRSSFTSLDDLQATHLSVHHLFQSDDGETFQVDLRWSPIGRLKKPANYFCRDVLVWVLWSCDGYEFFRTLNCIIWRVMGRDTEISVS